MVTPEPTPVPVPVAATPPVLPAENVARTSTNTTATSVPNEGKPASGSNKNVPKYILIGAVVLVSIAGVIAGVLGIKRVLDTRASNQADTEDTADGDNADDANEDDNGDDNGEDDGNEGDVAGAFTQVASDATDDYPAWTEADTIVAWVDGETYDQFHAMYAPMGAVQDFAVGAEAGDYMTGVEVINGDAVGYGLNKGDGTQWLVGIGNLMSGTSGDLYVEVVAEERLMEFSFVNEHAFVALVSHIDQVSGDETNSLRYLDTGNGTDETLWTDTVERSAREGMETDSIKVAVSPDGQKVYMVDTTLVTASVLRVFDLTTYNELGSVTNATQPAWVGNDDILYVNKVNAGGVYLYNIANDTSALVAEIDPEARDLCFAAIGDGLLGFNMDSMQYAATSYVYDIANDAMIQDYTHGVSRGIIAENLLMLEKYTSAPGGVMMDYETDRGGIWNYSNDGFTELTDYWTGLTGTAWNRY